ncbi:hypothetical protein [Cellulomonas triticagri]|uniref:hypothetical protein n=1 Tax=Cellulomonas triticagri TaxID=2483352 RepID=UPI001315A8AF|nr:hypothetical protein [Cellulomonas triticagri]
MIEQLEIAELERRAREHGWTEQADVLAKGYVTRADYEQAIDHVRACAEDGGNGISEPTLSPIDNLTLEFGFPVGAMDDEVIWDLSDRCLQRWHSLVETGYQVSHEAVMDADILAASLTCMADAGFPMVGEIRNARDMAARVSPEDGEVLSDCIVEAAMQVRPDLPMVGVAW